MFGERTSWTGLAFASWHAGSIIRGARSARSWPRRSQSVIAGSSRRRLSWILSSRSSTRFSPATRRRRASNGTRSSSSGVGCEPSTAIRAAMNGCGTMSAPRAANAGRRSSRSLTIRASAWKPTLVTSTSISPTGASRCPCWSRLGATRIARSCWPCPRSGPRRSCTAWSRRSRSLAACRARCGGTIPRRWRRTCSKAAAASSMGATRP